MVADVDDKTGSISNEHTHPPFISGWVVAFTPFLLVVVLMGY